MENASISTSAAVSGPSSTWPSASNSRMQGLISDPRDLTPQTTWQQTKWAWVGEEELVDHTTKARLCAAALLPFRDGQADWAGFAASIRWMQAAADHFGVGIPLVLDSGDR